MSEKIRKLKSREVDHTVHPAYRAARLINEAHSLASSLQTQEVQENAETEAGAEMVENLRGQLETSLQATNTILEQLNAMRGQDEQLPLVGEGELKVALEAKLEDWAQDGSLEWAAAQIERNGGGVILIATPNTLASPDEIIALAKNFGKDQPYETYVNGKLYCAYSAKELSGAPEKDANVRLSLIPSTLDPDLYGTRAKQLAALAKAKASTPSLKVPSVLDSLTHLQTLRAGGDKLADNETFDRTDIRHFNLPKKRLGRWLSVPYSCVDYDGRPYLDDSVAEFGSGARFAVG